MMMTKDILSKITEKNITQKSKTEIRFIVHVFKGTVRDVSMASHADTALRHIFTNLLSITNLKRHYI